MIKRFAVYAIAIVLAAWAAVCFSGSREEKQVSQEDAVREQIKMESMIQ